MRKVPARFREFTTRYPQIAEAYERLAGECNRLGALDERSRALVKLGIAVGSNVHGSVRSQVRKALDEGMKPDEIRQAILLGLTAIGFPRMMEALGWAEEILADESLQE